MSCISAFLDTTNEEGEQAEEADWEIASCLQGSVQEERRFTCRSWLMFGAIDTNRELQSAGEQEGRVVLTVVESTRIQRMAKGVANGQIPKPRQRLGRLR